MKKKKRKMTEKTCKTNYLEGRIDPVALFRKGIQIQESLET